MTFWIVLIVFALAATVFAGWPLYSTSRRLTPLLAVIIVFTVGLSAMLYNHVGSPGVPSGRGGTDADSLQGMDEAIIALEARLQANPEDLAGWKMLGRTHRAVENFAGAARAFEKAMELEEAKDAQTMVDLAVAIVQRDNVPIGGRTASLLESALALDPNNASALFYAGIAAANRGDVDIAADRWEKVLGLNPPADMIGVLQQNIAMWRGEPIPEIEDPARAAMPQDDVHAAVAEPVESEVPEDAIVAARVALSDEAMASLSADTNVFFIARDPAVPTPPIAVVRRRLSELPTVIYLTDANSMVAGRNLSMFEEVELVARVSLAGGPAAASGDWFGSLLVRPAEGASVSLLIDQRVP